MYGWTGKILEVDLTSATSRPRSLDEAVYRRYLGGRGLAGYFLRNGGGLAYGDDAMPICLFPGLLAGTGAPSAGHTAIATRSALTGILADARVSGRLGETLKKAGWDGVVITGVSSDLVCIDIRDDQVVISPNPPDGSPGTGTCVLETGSAAFAGVAFSTVVLDGRFPAMRGGVGPVFAAKNIQSIRVAGTGQVPVADPGAMKQAGADVRRLVAASPMLLGDSGLQRRGAKGMMALLRARKMVPSANFRETDFDGLGEALPMPPGDGRQGCSDCSIQCHYFGSGSRAFPGFEVFSHFTALLENHSLERALRAWDCCLRSGMDPISAAGTLACHGELHSVPVGAHLPELLEDVLAGRGEGAALAGGSYKLAARNGRADLSMSVKKLELSAIDPRGAYGLALGMAVSTVGGCWRRSVPIGYELLRKPVPLERFSFSAKARMVKNCEDAVAAFDSLGVCNNLFFAATLEEYAAVFTAATGISVTGAELAGIGASVVYNERLLNESWGLRGGDDLPERFFVSAGTPGPGFDVPPVDRTAFKHARDKYYRLRGLDEEGRPLPDMAERLELLWID